MMVALQWGCRCGMLLPSLQPALRYAPLYHSSYNAAANCQVLLQCNRFHSTLREKLRATTKKNTDKNAAVAEENGKMEMRKKNSLVLESIASASTSKFNPYLQRGDVFIGNPSTATLQEIRSKAKNVNTASQEHGIDFAVSFVTKRNRKALVANAAKKQSKITSLPTALVSEDQRMADVTNILEEHRAKKEIQLEDANDIVDWYKRQASKKTGDIPIRLSNAVLQIILSFDSHRSFADGMFGRLKNSETADKQTYEIFIKHALDYGRLKLAVQVYQEMSEKKMHAPLHLYNMILAHVCDVFDGDKPRWEFAQSVLADIGEAKLKPDQDTFNALMYVAFERKKNAPDYCFRLLCEMRHLKLTASLRGYYYLLISLKEKHEGCNTRKKTIYNFYLNAIMDELETGMVDFDAKHPDDHLFFNDMLHIAVKNQQGAIVEKLVNLVIEKNLLHLVTPILFIRGYVWYLIVSKYDVDHVMNEYRRLIPTYFEGDGRLYVDLFNFFRTKRDISHLPELYWDFWNFDFEGTYHHIEFLETLVCAMGCKIPPQRRHEYLHVVEHALSIKGVAHSLFFLSDKTPLQDPQEWAKCLIYLFCLNGKDEKIMELVRDIEKYQGINRHELMSAVYRFSLEMEEFDAAATALKVTLRDSTITDKQATEEIEQFGADFTAFRLSKSRAIFIPDQRTEMPVVVPRKMEWGGLSKLLRNSLCVIGDNRVGVNRAAASL